jgi:hypothetical protein
MTGKISTNRHRHRDRIKKSYIPVPFNLFIWRGLNPNITMLTRSFTDRPTRKPQQLPQKKKTTPTGMNIPFQEQQDTNNAQTEKICGYII